MFKDANEFYKFFRTTLGDKDRWIENVNDLAFYIWQYFNQYPPVNANEARYIIYHMYKLRRLDSIRHKLTKKNRVVNDSVSLDTFTLDNERSVVFITQNMEDSHSPTDKIDSKIDIDRFLTKLTKENKQLANMVKKYLEGYTYIEIAEQTNQSPRKINRMIKKALTSLSNADNTVSIAHL